MKRKRFVVILIAMAMSMLIVQGALAADEEMGELLESIEADRFTVVDDLVNRFAKDEVTAEQLRAILDSTSATKLAEIVQNADSLEAVDAILAGTEGILALGDLDRDYVYTPVTPCRIIDTRSGGGGVFTPGTTREYFVKGSGSTIGAQGGNPAGCSSPRGEPRGVHINVTAVPQSGQGNFRAYPANVAAPNASWVNYKAGVQNVANAGTVKTLFSVTRGEIRIQNRVGTSHLVVDVLGYYHDAEPEKVVAADGVDLGGSILVGSAPFTTLVSKTVTIRTSGRVILLGQASWRNISSAYVECRFTENGSFVDGWRWEAGDADGSVDFHQSRFHLKTVTSGTKTYRLQCETNAGTARADNRALAVLFVKEDL